MEKRQAVIALKATGLTHRTIAKRAGVSAGTVSNIVRAHQRESSTGTAMAQTRGGRKLAAKGAKPGTRAKKQGENTIARRYKLPVGTINRIKELGPLHGSQGRALQVATEFLIRMASPLKVEAPSGPDAMLGAMSYKLTPRTISLIDKLAEQYGTRGAVLVACAAVLDTRLRIVALPMEQFGD